MVPLGKLQHIHTHTRSSIICNIILREWKFRKILAGATKKTSLQFFHFSSILTLPRAMIAHITVLELIIINI